MIGHIKPIIFLLKFECLAYVFIMKTLFVLFRCQCILVVVMCSVSAIAKANDSGSTNLFYWGYAAKQSIGTSYEPQGHPIKSPVWFTVAENSLSEIYYPQVDAPALAELQFYFTDGKSWWTSTKSMNSKVYFKDQGMATVIESEDVLHQLRLQQTIITDSERSVLRVQIKLLSVPPQLQIYTYIRPAIGRKGSQSEAHLLSRGVIFYGTKPQDLPNTVVGFGSSLKVRKAHVGLVAIDDGLNELKNQFSLISSGQHAGPGHVGYLGQLDLANLDSEESPASPRIFEIQLSFAQSETEAQLLLKQSQAIPFQQSETQFSQGWKTFLKTLVDPPQFIKHDHLAQQSVQLIKMHEDKKHRGAIIAAFSIPSIPDLQFAHEDYAGYHLIWPRDLYQAALGLLAVGDLTTANAALDFLESRQLSGGHWPQNFWLNGEAFWTSIQMDEVSFPILLAKKLEALGRRLSNRDLNMITRAAQYIYDHGPTTLQERWEEVGGYVPSTLAAEIAALSFAGDRLNNANFKKRANEWNQLIELWTLVRESPLGKNYYPRRSSQGNQQHLDVAESQVLDAGFLELVRLGLRSYQDENIQNTLRMIDSPGLGLSLQGYYRRYTGGDMYGPERRGGFWPLLTGERGEAAIAGGDFLTAQRALGLIKRSATDSGLLPEQIIGFDNRGKVEIGLGTACPLVWSHAEYLRLWRGLEDRKIFF